MPDPLEPTTTVSVMPDGRFACGGLPEGKWEAVGPREGGKPSVVQGGPENLYTAKRKVLHLPNRILLGTKWSSARVAQL